MSTPSFSFMPGLICRWSVRVGCGSRRDRSIEQSTRKVHVWQPEPFDHIIRSADQFRYLRGYIADNPKKANLPIGEYLYWQSIE